MQTVVRGVKFIVSRALNHKQFRQFIEEYDTEYGDLLMHSEVRWLSRGKAWMVSEPPPWDLHFNRQQRKTRARAGRPMLDNTAGLSDWLHLSPEHSQFAASRRDKLPSNAECYQSISE